MHSKAVPSYAYAEQGAPYEPALSAEDPEYSSHIPATLVDEKDTDTPDRWIRRDPRLRRLTGRHPLNSEPPMAALMASGFITPPSIHFVRNHGAVPKLEWSTHRVNITGLVDRPMSLSMDEIIALPSITIPVTLTCSGNRRKEENMLKKSMGYNWGACATSCTYWTGVRLADLLNHCGVQGRDAEARYVTFCGPKGELPKGDNGMYGTSLTLAKALDPANDVLVAYKQNGRWLTPDHGFPVRMIVPGHIAGRMVKWLSEITVIPVESQNFYHFHDNRLLPSHVDEELAEKEGWWFKPDFIINDLNINSAAARPWHDEVIQLKENQPYVARGYAYTGGGRKVIRVELSLDDCATWKLAEIHRFEEPTEYCVAYPTLRHAPALFCMRGPVTAVGQLTTWDFLRAPELLVRAWDESMNTQPACLTWNLMGMMNNCYYRIKIHPHTDADGNMCLRFQHPAPIERGDLGHVGWREDDNLRAQTMAGVSEPQQPAAPRPKVEQVNRHMLSIKAYTMAQVAEHNSDMSAWFVHEGRFYDATPFLDEHPGGAEAILIVTGTDATEEFNAIHSRKAKDMLADYYIGDLIKGGTTPASEPPVALVTVDGCTAPLPTSAPVALNQHQRVRLRLSEVVRLNHNTRIFRFALPTPNHRLGLPVGKHVFVYGQANGESFMRPYTPISSDDELGHMDLLVKVYFANEHPDFPAGGKMSQHLNSLRLGDTVDVKGPVGHFVYEGHGSYTNGKVKGHARQLSMVAGGTGITPCYQVIKAVLKKPEDPTQMSLIFANRSQHDILLREELDCLAASHPSRFRIWYTIDARHADAGWKFGVGRVDEAILKAHIFPAAEGTLALVCGPPGLLNNAVIPNLERMKYPKEAIVMF